MPYTIQETETVIGLCHGEKAWDVYTSIPRHVIKFRKLAAKWGAEIKEIHEGGIRVKLPLKAISFRMPRELTPEQKEAAAARMRAWQDRKKQELEGVTPIESDNEFNDEEDEENEENDT